MIPTKISCVLGLIIVAAAFVGVRCDEPNFATGIKSVFTHYKQCENEAEMLTCLKLKALKIVDRALSINNIPIIEGISLAKKEDAADQRSLDENVVTNVEQNNLTEDSAERGKNIDSLLWNRIRQFVETRSLQLKINKLFFNDDNDQGESIEDGRGKKDKNKGMYVYLMMMKGGLMALAYKGLALLAGKALLVSKIALTLALLVAIKKLFSGGHHSQKTTYEIVKTPIVTHSHQYANVANGANAHYGGDFGGYETAPYGRSLETPDEIQRRTGVKAELQNPRYVTHIIETVEGRSLSDTPKNAQSRSLASTNVNFAAAENNQQKYNLPPYAHLVAYRNQLKTDDVQKTTKNPLVTDTTSTSTTTSPN